MNILVFLFWFFGSIISYFSSIVGAVYIVASQSCGILYLCQQKYRKDLILKYGIIEDQSSIGYNTKISPVVAEKVLPRKPGIFQDLVMGMELQCLIESFTGRFGAFFMMESTVDLITESIGAYLCFLMPLSRSGESFHLGMFVIGLGNLFLFILAMSRHYGIMRLGHNIAKGNSGIKNTLQKISVIEYDDMSDKEKHMMEILLERVSNPAPVSPFQIFALNFSTGLSALGLCLTYVIVLLQFRFGE